MCYLKPCTVKSIKNKKALMDNGIEAYYDKKIGMIKKDDEVLVYGNLIVKKITDER